MSKVTIGIPFYNAEKFLSEAIESVLSQKFQDWKLILIDDGSVDRSVDIAKLYAATDSRIKIYADGTNKGLAYRLNEITRLTDTEFLARMDADDVMHPSRISEQIKVLTADPEIDVLGTNAYTMDENGMLIGLRIKDVFDDQTKTVESFIHPTIMARTSWYENNPYDESALRMEDAELWFRTRDSSQFKVLLAPLFFYREVGRNYYKKYLSAYKCRKYVLNKYHNHLYWRKFFNHHLIVGSIYAIFNIFGKENLLIKRRNELLISKSIHYQCFIDQNKDKAGLD